MAHNLKLFAPGKRIELSTVCSLLGTDKCFQVQRAHMSRQKANTHYDVLNITPKATQSQVKSAYFIMSKKYHPDMNNSAEAKLIFADVTEAYEVLGNPIRRRQYDRGIMSHHHAGAVTEMDQPEPQTFEKFKRQSSVTKRGVQRGVYRIGQTDIYDFDEFYRQHYGDSIGKIKHANAAAHKQNVKDTDAKAQSLRTAGVIFGGLLIFFAAFKGKML